MNKKYELGNFICKLREEHGMDQKTLAQLLGVSPSAISQCENGGGVKTEKLFQLAELFGVTIGELLEAKRSDQTLEEKLDRLYEIGKYNVPELIASKDVDAIKEFYNRVSVINDNFYKLLNKWLFNRITDDEYKELCYLWQFFKTTTCLNKYIKTFEIWFNEEEYRNDIKEALSAGLGGFGNQMTMWELQKIFAFKLDLHIDEILELIADDDSIEHEEGNIACGVALFHALPKISQDLLYSKLVYSAENTLAVNELQRIMIAQGAELLYLPTIKNFTSIDKSIFEDVDGEIEFDESLTKAMRVYIEKYINDFEYQHWLKLTYSEYQLCIDKNKTEELKLLAGLQKEDMTTYWEKYKSVKSHIEQLKKVEI